ncbi:MAG: hypothetical protein K8E66_04005, partial [Phycisphaerales bacterium]|nr:hypothetical protein [Phycisphaerales bacterium]
MVYLLKLVDAAGFDPAHAERTTSYRGEPAGVVAGGEIFCAPPRRTHDQPAKPRRSSRPSGAVTPCKFSPDMEFGCCPRPWQVSVFRGRAEGREIEFADIRMESSDRCEREGEVRVFVRPHEFELSGSATGGPG